MNFPTAKKENSEEKDSKEDLKYSVKVTEIAKIKEVHIDLGKPIEKAEVVAELYNPKLHPVKFYVTYVKEKLIHENSKVR
jgi:hypothetical protein